MSGTDVMVDIEATGLLPGCAILSIGAVKFNPEKNTVGAQAVHACALLRALGSK